MTTLFAMAKVESLLRTKSSSGGSTIADRDFQWTASLYWKVSRFTPLKIMTTGNRDVPEPRNIAPDYGFIVRSERYDSAAVVTVDLKGPHNRLVHDDEKGILQSAEEVADSFNKYFRDPTYIDGKVVQPWYYNTVADVIPSALHTSTGCAVLCTHNKAIFFKVSAQKGDVSFDERRVSLTVDISRIYGWQADITTGAGFLAILSKRRR